jgi:hypothetical protein
MLIRLKKIFFLLLFLPQFLFSENNDSLKELKITPTILFFSETQFESPDSVQSTDSTLTNFQNYLPKNHLGNSGLAYNDIIFQNSSNTIGFNYSKNNYQNYFFSPNKLKFYNTRTPYTDLFYLTGSKKEQIFKMTFSCNVKKNWNITTQFNRIRSEGFYTRQNTNDNFVAVTSNFKSINNKYYFLASFIYNGIKNAENGGMVDDTAVSNNTVNLLIANRKNINKSVFFKQYFNFGRKLDDTSKLAEIIPENRLILTSLLEQNSLVYKDNSTNTGYYSNTYYDSLKTYDSTVYYKLENELTLKRLNNNKYGGLKDIFGYGISIKHQFVAIKQYQIDTLFNNVVVGANFFNTYSKNKFWWDISSKYFLIGYNKSNYLVAASIKKCVKDSLGIFILRAEIKSQSPDFIYNHYSSNHFKWDNYFKQSKVAHLRIYFSEQKYNFSMGGDFFNFTNLLYLDYKGLAKQNVGTTSVMSVFFKKNFTFNSWHLNNKITYQYTPGLTALRLPEYVLEHSLFYSSQPFKKAMKMQIGASLFYFAAYYTNAYNPATAQFYLQNDKKYGNYPFIDFFINAQIKTVSIFFKIDHINSGLMPGDYTLTPYYPMNTRAFKLGISWNFFD